MTIFIITTTAAIIAAYVAYLNRFSMYTAIADFFRSFNISYLKYILLIIILPLIVLYLLEETGVWIAIWSIWFIMVFVIFYIGFSLRYNFQHPANKNKETVIQKQSEKNPAYQKQRSKIKKKKEDR